MSYYDPEPSIQATEADAHVEWHINAGVPLGTPGCPQDACHGEDDYEAYLEEQEANAIRSFRGEFAFLSNFYPCPVGMRGIIYPTTEHAYQAAKTLSEAAREEIAEARTPGQAKRLGQRVKLRDDWEQIKLDVMLALLRAKFHPARRPGLAQALDATGDRMLVEGNTWGDTFWGVYQGEGFNHLGRLLEQVREENRRREDV